LLSFSFSPARQRLKLSEATDPRTGGQSKRLSKNLFHSNAPPTDLARGKFNHRIAYELVELIIRIKGFDYRRSERSKEIQSRSRMEGTADELKWYLALADLVAVLVQRFGKITGNLDLGLLIRFRSVRFRRTEH
jgi:hypothetical protein